MRRTNRTMTVPVGYTRSKRVHQVQGMTSGKAGVCLPIAAIPALREDGFAGVIQVTTEMMETQEILANKVMGRITAYLVPWLAFERFGGSRDLFDKSYWGEPLQEGDPVVPFIETHAMGAHGSKPVYKSLGLHAPVASQVNTMYLEAYNAIWNFRAKNRSAAIPLRDKLDASLARAFWMPGRFEHVVADWDAAMMDGAVAMNLVNPRIPVKGLTVDPGSSNGGTKPGYETDTGGVKIIEGWEAGLEAKLFVERQGPAGTKHPNIWAEMQAENLTFTLSGFERAKKLRGFAKLRERYAGHDDDYIISQLMNGITIPEQHLKNPVLLADKMVTFGQSKRYATDGDNLAMSATSGGAVVNLPIGYGRINTGGVIMVLAEFFPSQLFERQADPLFHCDNVDKLPLAMRDALDEQPVDIVTNGEVDTSHSDPDDPFGFAPMNWKWTSFGPRLGGKYYRPAVDAATDTTRKRFWAAETADPVLSEDFYLVPAGLHQKPFLDTEADPFEVTASGVVTLTGNTQFGPALHEAEDNYDIVDAETRVDQIDKGAV